MRRRRITRRQARGLRAPGAETSAKGGARGGIVSGSPLSRENLGVHVEFKQILDLRRLDLSQFLAFAEVTFRPRFQPWRDQPRSTSGGHLAAASELVNNW